MSQYPVKETSYKLLDNFYNHSLTIFLNFKSPFFSFFVFVYTISLPPHNRFYWDGRKLRASTTCAAKQAKFKKISEWRPHQYLTEPSKWLFNVSVSMLQESCFSKYEWRRTDERTDEILLWLVIGQGLVAWHKHSAQTVEVKWSLASLSLAHGL